MGPRNLFEARWDVRRKWKMIWQAVGQGERMSKEPKDALETSFRSPTPHLLHGSSSQFLSSWKTTRHGATQGADGPLRR